MTDDRSGDDRELDADERTALAAWIVPTAPADFASRVVQRQRAERRRQRGWQIGAAVALFAVAAATWWVLTPQRQSSAGEWTATARSTIEMGDRATAVAEPESAGEWQVAASGHAHITQQRGSVFYRVEPGGDFVVQTPAGQIRVTGTCFQLEVMEMDRSKLTSGAIGAAVAALTVVTVYEGRVVASTTERAQEVQAGQAATLDGRRVWLAGEQAPPELATAQQGLIGAKPARPSSQAVGQDALLLDNPTYVALLQERSALSAQVQELQGQVQELQKKTRVSKTYDLTQEELLGMAEVCEVRWDWEVPDVDKPRTMSDKQMQKLDLTEEQRAALDAVLKRYSDELSAEMRALYSKLTGDPNVGSMAIESMLWEAMDKTPREETLRVYHQVAHERAGVLPPPTNMGALPVFEQMFRLVHGAGDRLEADMAAAVGEQVAGEVRDLHGGFGSKSRLRNGCPGEAE